MKILTRILIDTKEYDRLKKIENQYEELMRAKKRAEKEPPQTGSGQSDPSTTSTIRQMFRDEFQAMFQNNSLKTSQPGHLPSQTLPPMTKNLQIMEKPPLPHSIPDVAPDASDIIDIAQPIAPTLHEDTHWYFLGE